MKFLVLLFIPVILHSQTIHQEDGEIVYKGKVPFTINNSTDKYNQVEQIFLSTITKEGKLLSNSTVDDHKFSVFAEFPLTSTPAITNSTRYILTVHVQPSEYSYKIDSVQVIEHIRGGNTTSITSKDFLNRMDQTGPVAMATERVLNEIDMKIQKLLATTNKKIQNNIPSK